MITIPISEPVAKILLASIITQTSLHLPPGQLDRTTYTSCNKVIEVLGGQWDKKSKSHLFTTDPRERIKNAIRTRTASMDIQVVAPKLQAKARKKELQTFYTPRDLAEKLVKIADVFAHRVLEPSAGMGALAEACARAGAKAIKCIDIDPVACERLRADGLTGVTHADFLSMAPTPFTRIVMNPPFTRNQDIIHVAHALKFLAPEGVLVSIMSGNTERHAFKKLVSGLNHEITPIPAGSFKESGTMASTIILRVESPVQNNPLE